MSSGTKLANSPYFSHDHTASTGFNSGAHGGSISSRNRRFRRQEVSHDRPAVVAPPVPHDDHVPPQVLQHVTEEPDDLVGREESARLGREVEPEPPAGRRDGDRPDGRHLVPVAAVGGQDRRLSNLRPRPPHQRVEEQPGLVDQDEVGSGFGRFFSIRGQSVFTHPSMAGWSFCFARRRGFCGLSPRPRIHARR